MSRIGFAGLLTGVCVVLSGCVSTAHLSGIAELKKEPNPVQRLRYVARLQKTLLKYTKQHAPNADKMDFLHDPGVYVDWAIIGKHDWLCALTHSHHVDHTWSERKRVNDIAVALDSRGKFYYSLWAQCDGQRGFFGKPPYVSIEDFMNRNRIWIPLPDPNAELGAGALHIAEDRALP